MISNKSTCSSSISNPTQYQKETAAFSWMAITDFVEMFSSIKIVDPAVTSVEVVCAKLSSITGGQRTAPRDRLGNVVWFGGMTFVMKSLRGVTIRGLGCNFLVKAPDFPRWRPVLMINGSIYFHDILNHLKWQTIALQEKKHIDQSGGLLKGSGHYNY